MGIKTSKNKNAPYPTPANYYQFEKFKNKLQQGVEKDIDVIKFMNEYSMINKGNRILLLFIIKKKLNSTYRKKFLIKSIIHYSLNNKFSLNFETTKLNFQELK